MVVMKINKVSFGEKVRHIGLGIVNRLIGINTKYHFLVGMLPLLDLMYYVGEKELSGVGCRITLSLEEADFFFRDCVGSCIKFLVTDAVS